MAELWELTAEEAVRRLTAGEVSPLELVDASIARIEAVDGAVNALPLHRFDRARDDARRLGDVPPGERGLLAGLPIAIKDLIDVEGMRTTYGCPLYADNVASKSDPLVTRLEARGGVVVAKSSSPEMGMMPVTTNRVFGHTRNPWNLETTPGGSSGGASAALAAGEVWLAHGSDIGGSLRIPAAFAGVCGLRPSPGRVPRTHSHRCFNPMSVQGPMARSVGDIALFLDAMAGYLANDPLSLPDPEGSFRAEGKRPARIGYVADIGLGGVEPDVAAVVEGALAGLDIPVEPLALDFGNMSRLFSVMIGHNTLIERADFIAENREKLERVLGLLLDFSNTLTAEDFIWAERGARRRVPAPLPGVRAGRCHRDADGLLHGLFGRGARRPGGRVVRGAAALVPAMLGHGADVLPDSRDPGRPRTERHAGRPPDRRAGPAGRHGDRGGPRHRGSGRRAAGHRPAAGPLTPGYP